MQKIKLPSHPGTNLVGGRLASVAQFPTLPRLHVNKTHLLDAVYTGQNKDKDRIQTLSEVNFTPREKKARLQAFPNILFHARSGNGIYPIVHFSAGSDYIWPTVASGKKNRCDSEHTVTHGESSAVPLTEAELTVDGEHTQVDEKPDLKSA